MKKYSSEEVIGDLVIGFTHPVKNQASILILTNPVKKFHSSAEVYPLGKNVI